MLCNNQEPKAHQNLQLINKNVFHCLSPATGDTARMHTLPNLSSVCLSKTWCASSAGVLFEVGQGHLPCTSWGLGRMRRASSLLTGNLWDFPKLCGLLGPLVQTCKHFCLLKFQINELLRAVLFQIWNAQSFPMLSLCVLKHM